MRRYKIAALMITLVLLSACGSREGEAEFEKFRTSLTAAAESAVTADVTADYGDRVGRYTLSADETGEGCAVEVLAPELIAGVKAHIDAGGSVLEYDGVVLDTGDLTDDGLTPVSALPRLISAMRAGHVESVWREGKNLAVKLVPDDEITVTVWLDEGSLSPVRAELESQENGRVLITCEIKEFSIR